jgi:SAM-dependent methyltransferase
MKLYNELAPWWQLMSRHEDYKEESALYWQTISKYKQDIVSALELGCGGGNNAYYLKQKCQWTLTDLSPAMLDMSRSLNPECQHYAGDMRNLDLGITYDLVFIHDAIMYMTSADDLSRVFKTARKHLKPDGLLFIAPDHFRETFREETDHGGYNEEHRRFRYLEWSMDRDPQDDIVETEYVYLLNEGGHTQCIHETVNEGIFSKDIWRELLQKEGFKVSFETIPHSELEPGSYIAIVGLCD